MGRFSSMSLGIASFTVSLLLVSAPGAAAPRYSGVVAGSFDAPVLSGTFLRPGSHEPVPCDNAATARPSGVGTGTIAWRDDSNGPTAAASSVTFSGSSFVDVAPGQTFRLGTLTFVNGPGGPASLIFGFDIALSAGDGVAPFTGSVQIVSTQNANQDRIADADVLSFSDFEAPSTLAAFEDAAVTAVVYGAIGDDGALRVTSIGLAPGEAEHGCVGDAPFDASKGACGSSCDGLCAVGAALTRPLCGAEPIPAAVVARIRKATGVLGDGSTTLTARQAKRAARRAMRQLRRSAALASRAARQGGVSTACAESIGAAVVNAETRAAPMLRAR